MEKEKMIEKRQRRKTCIVCERELPKISSRGRKRKRILTCSPKCSRDYVRIRIYTNLPYINKIKELKEEIKMLKGKREFK